MEDTDSQPVPEEKDLTELQRIRQALFGEDLCRINLRLKKMEEQLESSINGFSEYIGHLERKLTTRLDEMEASLAKEFKERDEHLRSVQVSIAGMQQLYGDSLEKVQNDLEETGSELREGLQEVEKGLTKQVEENAASIRQVVEEQNSQFTKGQEDLGEFLVTMGAKLKTAPKADPEEPIFKKTNGHKASDKEGAKIGSN